MPLSRPHPGRIAECKDAILAILEKESGRAAFHSQARKGLNLIFYRDVRGTVREISWNRLANLCLTGEKFSFELAVYVDGSGLGAIANYSQHIYDRDCIDVISVSITEIVCAMFAPAFAK